MAGTIETIETVSADTLANLKAKWYSLVGQYNALGALYKSFELALASGRVSPALAVKLRSEIGLWPQVQAQFDRAKAAVGSWLGNAGNVGIVPLLAIGAVLVILAGAGAYIANRYTAAKALEVQLRQEELQAAAAGGFGARLSQGIKDITGAGAKVGTYGGVGLAVAGVVALIIWLKLNK